MLNFESLPCSRLFEFIEIDLLACPHTAISINSSLKFTFFALSHSGGMHFYVKSIIFISFVPSMESRSMFWNDPTANHFALLSLDSALHQWTGSARTTCCDGRYRSREDGCFHSQCSPTVEEWRPSIPVAVSVRGAQVCCWTVSFNKLPVNSSTVCSVMHTLLPWMIGLFWTPVCHAGKVFRCPMT